MSFGEMEKVLLYINLTKSHLQHETNTAPRTWSLAPLHHAPTTSTSSSPLQFSLREMVRDLQLGQRGVDKMGRVSLLSCFPLQWDPNPFFYRPKGIVMVGVAGYGQSNS
jgi:hypothetical protein